MNNLAKLGSALLAACIVGYWVAVMSGSGNIALGMLFGVTAVSGFLVGVACAAHKPSI